MLRQTSALRSHEEGQFLTGSFTDYALPRASLMSGRVPHLDASDIRDKSAAGFVTGSDDPRKTRTAERLSASGIRDHNLITAKERVDLAGAKHRLIAIGAGHDD